MQSFPKQSFFFYLAQDFGQAEKDSIRRLILNLAASRSWSIEPPVFFDGMDAEGNEVVGGALEVYSALPPNKLPYELDAKNLEEVECLVSCVRDLSFRDNLSFEFQLDSVYVGSIEDGVVDTLLKDGLIAAWKEGLSLSR